MAATEGRKEWLTNLVSSVAAVSVLVGAVAVGPLAAVAKAKVVDNRREPVVQALVQLPDELDDWTRWVMECGSRTTVHCSFAAGFLRC